jgi:hypothetical protein
MEPDYFKKMSPEDRKSLLEGDAISVEETTYTRPLTPEEVVYYKDLLSTKSVEQATILDDKKEVIASFKARLDPVAAEIKTALSAVKYKAVQCAGRLYRLADYENQMIHTVDSDGNLINSRMMRPEERQFRIQALKQQAV